MVNVSARTLFEHGYTNVYNLGGGTQAWLEAGFTGEE
jgi:rhodanese-related sulfurtransferase